MGMNPRAVGDRSPLNPSTAERPGTQLVSLQVRNVLRQAQDPGVDNWYWAVNPYRGCQYGCTFCHVRLETRDHDAWNAFEQRIGVKVNLVETLVRELREVDLGGRPLVLGTNTEPWQQSEEKVRLTRTVLEALAKMEGLDLRVNTRSSLVARDVDVLREIARRGRVSVTFSLASMDERINRLLEPNAPSAMRRFAAMEALAHNGIEVGMLVSPVLPGLEEEELGLEAMLSRAAHAGARFAGMGLLSLAGAHRETFLFHVDRKYPELSSRFRRVIGRKPPSPAELQNLHQRFGALCAAYDLRPLAEAHAPRKAEERPPSQLSLFL